MKVAGKKIIFKTFRNKSFALIFAAPISSLLYPVLQLH